VCIKCSPFRRIRAKRGTAPPLTLEEKVVISGIWLAVVLIFVFAVYWRK